MVLLRIVENVEISQQVKHMALMLKYSPDTLYE